MRPSAAPPRLAPGREEDPQHAMHTPFVATADAAFALSCCRIGSCGAAGRGSRRRRYIALPALSPFGGTRNRARNFSLLLLGAAVTPFAAAVRVTGTLVRAYWAVLRGSGRCSDEVCGLSGHFRWIMILTIISTKFGVAKHNLHGCKRGSPNGALTGHLKTKGAQILTTTVSKKMKEYRRKALQRLACKRRESALPRDILFTF